MSTINYTFPAPTPGTQTQKYAKTGTRDNDGEPSALPPMKIGDTFRGKVIMLPGMKLSVAVGEHLQGWRGPIWMWLEDEGGAVVWRENKATTGPHETLDPTELPEGEYYLCANRTKNFKDESAGYANDRHLDGNIIVNVSWQHL